MPETSQEPPPLEKSEALSTSKPSAVPAPSAATGLSPALPASAEPEFDKVPAQSEASSSTPPETTDHDTPTKLKPLAVVVDVAVGLILVVIGGWLGEKLAGEPTTEVWKASLTAPKFPPEDLLLWLSPPVLLGLTYGLMSSRRKSLGTWLLKRLQRRWT